MRENDLRETFTGIDFYTDHERIRAIAEHRSKFYRTIDKYQQQRKNEKEMAPQPKLGKRPSYTNQGGQVEYT